MAVNMSEFVPDNNLNWLALAACVYGNITAGRALCCLGLVGTNPKRGYKRVSELDGNSLLKMHQAGMSLRAIGYKAGADYKTVKRALKMNGVEF
nr:MAG TPA: InsA C-terminal domain [Caudoviricetes sp.]